MNSLKVVLDPCQSPGIFSTKIWIREGSRADPVKKKGIHNLLSSLLTRGCGPYNTLEIADLFESFGADLNCETYEDGIMISLKCIEDKSSYLLPILNYMITEPHLEEKQLLLEKKLSIQSILRQRENPSNIAFKQWKKIAYSNHPYGYEIIGNIKDIKSINKEEITTLSKSLIYRKKIMIISGSLPSNIEDTIKNMSNIYNLSNKKLNEFKVKNENNKTENRKENSIILNYQDTKQVVIIIGQKTIPYSHPDDLALRIIASHLGLGMSSLLFRLFREESGLTYDVGVYHPMREYEAPFLFHASSSEEKSLATLKLLLKCWKDLQKEQILEEDIKLAKAKFIGNTAHNSQSISQKAERKAYLLGINLKITHDLDNLEKLKELKSNDLRKCAINNLQSPKLSLVGPKNTLNKLCDFWMNEKI